MADPTPAAISEELRGRSAQMFPHLGEAQLARLERLGTRRRVAAGELLFDQGQALDTFFVVLSGELEIVRPGYDSLELITLHGPGQFTGETNLLLHRRSLVRGRARVDSEVVEITGDRLRELVQTDSELSEIIMRAFLLRRTGLIAGGLGDALIIGSRHSAGTLRVREFLGRNAHPYSYVDIDSDAGVEMLLGRFHVRADEVPIVICRGERVLRNPSNEEVADCFGLRVALEPERLHDVLVVGAGPAGLAAAVYGASEGLDVLVLEGQAPGGQAGSSSRIENYLGFPTGITGEALAGRAFAQAEKFGANVAIARTAARLGGDPGRYEITLTDGSVVRGRTVVIACGASYNKIPVAELERFEGTGVYYGATHVEAQLCAGDEVIVVGGGNSAGQAAVFLSGRARHVHMLVRGPGLAATMSRYLIRRIEDTPSITLRTGTEIDALAGADRLEQVTWRTRGGERSVNPIRHVFLMTGASPHTAWLDGRAEVDDKGFVRTGLDLAQGDLSRWPLQRPPFHLETSAPGVFAAGDVRAGSMKRVAAAVGEGATAIALIHRVLAGA